MKKYFLLPIIIINILLIANASACPCGFSPDDARPFFEQYEEKEKITPQPPIEEKEKES